MFICQFFNQNLNFKFSNVTKVMSRVKVNTENGNQSDHNRELFIFSNMHVIHVHMPIFQWESKFWGYKDDKGHIVVPGKQ